LAMWNAALEHNVGRGAQIVDLESGTVSIGQVLTYAAGKLHYGAPKSAAGERTISLPAPVLAALRRHRKAQGERRLIAGEAWQDLDLVIDRGDGGPWSPPSFSKGWERFAARTGFSGITFHGLRHGVATLMLAGGVPDAVAVEIMGHADTRILRRYQEVIPQLKREAAARLESLLSWGAE
jgi:integrase